MFRSVPVRLSSVCTHLRAPALAMVLLALTEGFPLASASRGTTARLVNLKSFRAPRGVEALAVSPDLRLYAWVEERPRPGDRSTPPIVARVPPVISDFRFPIFDCRLTATTPRSPLASATKRLARRYHHRGYLVRLLEDWRHAFVLGKVRFHKQFQPIAALIRFLFYDRSRWSSVSQTTFSGKRRRERTRHSTGSWSTSRTGQTGG